MNLKQRRKRQKLERELLKKITPIQPSKDYGKFFHYCSFHHHPGIIGRHKAKICIRRKCEYYQKYRREK